MKENTISRKWGNFKKKTLAVVKQVKRLTTIPTFSKSSFHQSWYTGSSRLTGYPTRSTQQARPVSKTRGKHSVTGTSKGPLASLRHPPPARTSTGTTRPASFAPHRPKGAPRREAGSPTTARVGRRTGASGDRAERCWRGPREGRIEPLTGLSLLPSDFCSESSSFNPRASPTLALAFPLPYHALGPPPLSRRIPIPARLHCGARQLKQRSGIANRLFTVPD